MAAASAPGSRGAARATAPPRPRRGCDSARPGGGLAAGLARPGQMSRSNSAGPPIDPEATGREDSAEPRAVLRESTRNAGALGHAAAPSSVTRLASITSVERRGSSGRNSAPRRAVVHISLSQGRSGGGGAPKNAYSPRHARAMPAPRPRHCPVTPGGGGAPLRGRTPTT
eukprot:gene2-biopygen1